MALMYTDKLPQQRYQAKQVLDNELLIAQKQGIGSYQLMLNAGAAVFALINDSYQSGPMLVLCGKGNNGGDGYVVAKLALLRGFQVTVIQIGGVKALVGDANQAYQDYRYHGGEVSYEIYDQQDVEQLLNDDHNYTIVVDAVLGIGFNGELRQPTAAVLQWLSNQRNCSIVSVDLPSGIDPDTGVAVNWAVQANKTVTFIAVKQGLSTADGPDHCGDLYYADTMIGNSFHTSIPAKVFCVDQTFLRQWLPSRRLATHKGNCGKVLLIGSDQGMSGAVRLAALACFRSGAGIVRILTHQDNEAIVASEAAECIVHGVSDQVKIRSWLEQADVIAIGPGMGGSDWGRAMLEQLLSFLSTQSKRCVLDADALNVLARLKFSPNFDLDSIVITPHPLEAARLLNCKTQHVQADRFAAARQLTDKYGAVALLKGVGTVINVGGHAPYQYVNSTGNPGMATAGMGDVLTGIIAGLMAQGLPTPNAAILGAYIHGAAADLAAKQGERGMMATDVIAYIRQVVN